MPEPTQQPAIQPLPLKLESAAANAATPVADKPSLDEHVDNWMHSHPSGATFDEKEPVATTTTSEPPSEGKPAEPPGGAPAPGAAEAPPSGTVAKEPSAPPIPEPQAKVEQPPQKPEDKPAAPASVRFALDNKYTFVDNGPEWTGQQIVDGLRERAALVPRAQEADVYREVFDMPAAQAKELWAPNIAWLRNNPDQVRMIASIIDDPRKSQYIAACSQYWDSPEGQQLRAQNPAYASAPAPAMSPEVEARFKQLETQNKQLLEAETSRRTTRATERIQGELNVAFERYPYLRDNPAMVQSLLARAYWLNGGDDNPNAKGVLDALDMERDLYDSKLAALNAATQIAREAPQAPAPPVPPLMGAAGAAPQATQNARAARPKAFGDLDDAVDEWMKNPPAEFR